MEREVAGQETAGWLPGSTETPTPGRCGGGDIRSDLKNGHGLYKLVTDREEVGEVYHLLGECRRTVFRGTCSGAEVTTAAAASEMERKTSAG